MGSAHGHADSLMVIESQNHARGLDYYLFEQSANLLPFLEGVTFK